MLATRFALELFEDSIHSNNQGSEEGRFEMLASFSFSVEYTHHKQLQYGPKISRRQRTVSD